MNFGKFTYLMPQRYKKPTNAVLLSTNTPHSVSRMQTQTNYYKYWNAKISDWSLSIQPNKDLCVQVLGKSTTTFIFQQYPWLIRTLKRHCSINRTLNRYLFCFFILLPKGFRMQELMDRKVMDEGTYWWYLWRRSHHLFQLFHPKPENLYFFMLKTV